MNFIPSSTQSTILCCQCGVPMTPNPANMCVDCIKNEVDITEGIPKQSTIHFCKFCERYLQPPNQWLTCQLESKELLALCLKKLKGLSKVHLVDAGFVWTEPHSKRVKVKVTIQKEVFAATILQQVFVVEYVVANQMCDECRRVEAKDTWNAVVQLRQKVNHKKTFYYLEQLILKHAAHKNTSNLKEVPDGIDFFYSTKTNAIKFIDFLNSVVPIKYLTSQQLISADLNSNTYNFKYTFSVEIVPICKDDLICMPPKMKQAMGLVNPLYLCHRVGTSVHLIDPMTLQACEFTTQAYWRNPFTSLCSTKELIEYVILDVEPLGPTRGKYVLANAQVAKSSDFGKNDKTYFTRTHLGHLFQAGDYALGFDVTGSNFNSEDFDKLNQKEIPDVIIVKKSYPQRRSKNKTRHWKLKRLAENSGLEKKKDVQRAEEDFEEFMKDLEEDPELRQSVSLFKSGGALAKDEDDEEDFPEVQLEELLDEMNLDDPDDEDEGEEPEDEKMDE